MDNGCTLKEKTHKGRKMESKVLGLDHRVFLIATKFALNQEEIEGFGAILMTLIQVIDS